jgi:hypothetical protein
MSRMSTAAPLVGGRRIKPSRKSRGVLAERHARAAVRNDLATDDTAATDETAVSEPTLTNGLTASPADVPIDVKFGVG